MQVARAAGAEGDSTPLPIPTSPPPVKTTVGVSGADPVKADRHPQVTMCEKCVELFPVIVLVGAG